MLTDSRVTVKGRERGEERNIDMRRRNAVRLPLARTLTRDWACSTGTRPDRESNLQPDPSAHGTVLQPTEPHQSGLGLFLPTLLSCLRVTVFQMTFPIKITDKITALSKLITGMIIFYWQFCFFSYLFLMACSGYAFFHFILQFLILKNIGIFYYFWTPSHFICFIFNLFLLNLLGWQWFIRLYRFQVYISITHYLHIALYRTSSFLKLHLECHTFFQNPGQSCMKLLQI